MISNILLKLGGIGLMAEVYCHFDDEKLMHFVLIAHLKNATGFH